MFGDLGSLLLAVPAIGVIFSALAVVLANAVPRRTFFLGTILVVPVLGAFLGLGLAARHSLPFTVGGLILGMALGLLIPIGLAALIVSSATWRPRPYPPAVTVLAGALGFTLGAFPGLVVALSTAAKLGRPGG